MKNLKIVHNLDLSLASPEGSCEDVSMLTQTARSLVEIRCVKCIP